MLTLLSLMATSIIWRTTAALQMTLGFGQRKCFSEDLSVHRPILLDFRTSAGRTDMSVDLFVTDPRGHVIYHQTGLTHKHATVEPPVKLLVMGGKLPDVLPFRFCVMHQAMPSQIVERTERRIAFSIRSGATKEEKHDLIRARDVVKTGGNLRKLEEQVLQVLDKVDVLREQERLLTLKNETTTSFLTTSSSFCSLLVVLVGVLQVDYIRGIMRKRKLVR